MTHNYYPLTAGSWIDYTVIKITGSYHAPSMYLSVASREVIPETGNGRQRITCLPSGDIIARVYGKAGVTCTVISPPNAALYTEVATEGAGEAGGFAENALGTSGGFTTLTLPPILLVPTDLTTNHSPSPLKSAVYRATTDGILSKEGDFSYKTGVIGRGSWGPWPDTIRVGYMENPQRGPVYNYVYANGIGCVNFWYGEISPSGALLWGIEYYATAWGGQ